MTIVTIDGNIGCGKTSVLNYLHKTYKIPVVLEPVDNWEEYLIKLYEYNSGVFDFQVKIWLDRCWIQEKTDKTAIIVERSPLFIKHVFIKAAKLQNLITDEEEQILYNIHRNTDCLWKDNNYIYLYSNFENCLSKIKKRNRIYENNVSIEYIKLLHELHENVYESSSNIKRIDVDNKTVQEIGNEIVEYMKSNKIINI